MRRSIWLGALWGGLLLTVFDLGLAYRYLGEYRFRNDFRLVYGAAAAAARLGWDHLYDLGAQRAEVEALGAGFYWQPYLNPPPLAALAWPLLGLPFLAALALWTGLLGGSLLATWWLAAPGGGLARAAHLLLSLGLFPVAFGLAVGQPGALVAAAIVGGWRLLGAGRPIAAGVVLASGVAIKPQLAFLVPFCLLLAGERRAFASAAVGGAALGAVSGAALTTAGLARWHDALTIASAWSGTRRFTAAELLGTGASLLAFQLAVVVATLLVARRARSREVAIAAGIMGSLLATPYLGFQDFIVLVPAAWLLLRTGPPGWQLALMAGGYVVLEAAVGLGTPVVLGFRLAWLLSLFGLGSGRRD